MEHEITGHTRKVYKIWKNPGTSSWKKIKEIGIEILIIVFAVSLAAFLERQREHSNEQKEVKAFLTGIQNDLRNDIREMENDKLSFESAHYAFRYISSAKPNQSLSNDSVGKYNRYIFNITGLVPNDGRYQGFKSSGKITTIENNGLQNDILDLYQEDIPSLLNATNSYNTRKDAFFRYVVDIMKRNPDGSNNLVQILNTDKAVNITTTLAFTQEILSRFDAVINKSKKILAAIDHEYK
jgi:hypothetical protein